MKFLILASQTFKLNCKKSSFCPSELRMENEEKNTIIKQFSQQPDNQYLYKIIKNKISVSGFNSIKTKFTPRKSNTLYNKLIFQEPKQEYDIDQYNPSVKRYITILYEYFKDLDNKLLIEIKKDFNLKNIDDYKSKLFNCPFYIKYLVAKEKFKKNYILIHDNLTIFLIKFEGMRTNQKRRLLIKNKHTPDIGDYYKFTINSWLQNFQNYQIKCLQFQEQIKEFEDNYNIYSTEVKNQISNLYQKKNSII